MMRLIENLWRQNEIIVKLIDLESFWFWIGSHFSFYLKLKLEVMGMFKFWISEYSEDMGF